MLQKDWGNMLVESYCFWCDIREGGLDLKSPKNEGETTEKKTTDHAFSLYEQAVIQLCSNLQPWFLVSKWVFGLTKNQGHF